MEARKKENPIAVFDSGVGGISVLRELVKVMPNEDYIYFGDSKNAPYGTKELDEIRSLTEGHAKDLFEKGAKSLVVACNTATSASVRRLRQIYPDIPIVGIEPAVKPAATFMTNPTVLVMATPMTIHQDKLKDLISQYADIANILPLACPGLMDFVERDDLAGDDLRKYLEELLYGYRKEKLDAVVLGCTHYPFVKDMIQSVLGNDIKVFDGGPGTAREMKRRLEEADLINPSKQKGIVTFTNSLDNAGKIELCKKLFEKK